MAHGCLKNKASNIINPHPKNLKKDICGHIDLPGESANCLAAKKQAFKDLTAAEFKYHNHGNGTSSTKPCPPIRPNSEKEIVNMPP